MSINQSISVQKMDMQKWRPINEFRGIIGWNIRQHLKALNTVKEIFNLN